MRLSFATAPVKRSAVSAVLPGSHARCVSLQSPLCVMARRRVATAARDTSHDSEHFMALEDRSVCSRYCEFKLRDTLGGIG